MSQFFDPISRKSLLDARMAGPILGDDVAQRQVIKDALQLLGLPPRQLLIGRKHIVDLPVDPADLECFRAMIQAHGGFESFAINMVGEDTYRLLVEHFQNVADEEGIEASTVEDLVMGIKPKAESIPKDGPSPAYKVVLETSIARKEYVQEVEGREVPSYELDTSETLSRVTIPYVRSKEGVVLTHAHYKRALGIKLESKNEEWDRKPILEIYAIREGGEVKLAMPITIKLRQVYDEAQKKAVEALKAAKARQVFDPEVSLLFREAAAKKMHWSIFKDAVKIFRNSVGTEGVPMTLDTGYGPWPCQGMHFKKGNFTLAIRVLKDDMTDDARAQRAVHVAAWKEQRKAAQLQQLFNECGDIPMV